MRTVPFAAFSLQSFPLFFDGTIRGAMTHDCRTAQENISSANWVNTGWLFGHRLSGEALGIGRLTDVLSTEPGWEAAEWFGADCRGNLIVGTARTPPGLNKIWRPCRETRRFL